MRNVLRTAYCVLLITALVTSPGCARGGFNENGAWIIGSGKITMGERSVECLQLPRLGQK